jgi:hypothetical protein
VVNVVSPTKGPTSGMEEEREREGGVEKEEDRRKEKEKEGEKFCSIPCLSQKV